MKANKMKEDFNFGEKIGAMQSDVSHIKETVDDLTTNLKDYMSVNKADMAKHCEESNQKYLTKIEFQPYKKGIIFVVGLLVSLVITYAFNSWADYKEKVIKRMAKINTIDNQ